MKSKAEGGTGHGRRDSGNEGRFAGNFAYEGLDRVIHERARLSILTSLITNPKGVSFGDLKQLCSLIDGNLSRRLRVLERTELLKSRRNRPNRPLTICRISPRGANDTWNTLPPWNKWSATSNTVYVRLLGSVGLARFAATSSPRALGILHWARGSAGCWPSCRRRRSAAR